MKEFRLAVALVFIVGFTGCSSSGEASTNVTGERVAATEPQAVTVMPDVIGKALDVALSDIKSAGFEDEADVVGGGTFGVVNESNWQVCDQSPAAGETVSSAPQLTVERSCQSEASAPMATPTTTEIAPISQPSEDAPPEPTESVPEVSAPAPEQSGSLNQDLGSLLAGTDTCSDTIEAFATKYRDQLIEFDANIGAMNKHGEYGTRYDILIIAGDYSETSAPGPGFQFRDVGISDLNLTGSNIPDSIGVGDNLHVVATVERFERPSCIFLLDPVSTEVR
jgi:hypothetical protein